MLHKMHKTTSDGLNENANLFYDSRWRLWNSSDMEFPRLPALTNTTLICIMEVRFKENAIETRQSVPLRDTFI